MSFRRVKCSRCGAMKEQTAAEKCRPYQDPTGEYECPMSDWPTDEDGWFIGAKRTRNSSPE